MIACEVMFVEQRAGGSQGSSVWLVQLVLHSLCSNEQTLFHPFSLVGCQGCYKLSFLPSHDTWLMRTDLCSCLGHLQNGCEAMANSLLVLMPHEQTHGASSILKQIEILSPDGTKARAVKNVMKLIPDSLSVTKVALMCRTRRPRLETAWVLS